jgi:hypothetical protein
MKNPFNPESEEENDRFWEDYEYEEGENSEAGDIPSEPWHLPEEEDLFPSLEEFDEDACVEPLYDEFTDIPAWQKAHKLALKVSAQLRRIDRRVQRHPAIINLRGQSYLAAVDIAFGHEEGYEPEGLDVHLHRLEQGLGRIHQCLNLIDTVQRLEIVSETVHREIFNLIIETRDSLVHWMEEIRQYGEEMDF